MTTFIKPVAAAAVCLTFFSGVFAQQPFDSLPQPAAEQATDEQDPAVLPSEPPIQITPRTDQFGDESFDDMTGQDQAGDQVTLVNSQYSGWGGATAARDANQRRVGNELRANWIMVDSNGRFTGKVLTGKGADAANMNIFLMNMGRLVKQTSVNDEGEFSFTNVRQGAYALIGWGPKGFFTFGLNILAHNPATFPGAINQIKPTAFQNASTINTDWIRHFASRVGFRVYGRYLTDEGPNDPNRLYGLIGLYNNLPASRPATSLTSHIVHRTADGLLVGRVHQFNSINGRPVDLRSTKVLLLEDDSVVASTTTDNFGVFEFKDVPDGSYAVLAAGADGVGLIGIEVADEAANGEPDGPSKGMIDFTMVSSETIGWLNYYSSEVAYRRMVLARRPTAPEQPKAGCPTCNNQPGGCADCQARYLRSYCRSRGLTFEEWQIYCQGVKSGFGDGYFLREAGKDLRRRLERTNDLFDKAFYPSEFGY